MNLKTTNVFAWNWKAAQNGYRIIVNQGGSSSGKTYSILQCLFLNALDNPNTLTTVTASTFPALRKGALRDFSNICASEVFKPFVRKVDLSTNTYTLASGSTIEFAIFPTEQDAKNGKRQYLFINEADGFAFGVANNLIMRTSQRVYIDFNPTSFFWCHEKYKGRADTKWIYSTYRDNAYASSGVIGEIEQLKYTDIELYKVYGLGKFGKLVGVVFPNVSWIDESQMPQYPDKRVYCMDIGFSQSYTTLVDLRLFRDELYGHEMLYERGLNDKQIGLRLLDVGILPGDRVVIDSANGMLINYLNEEFNIYAVACQKRDVVAEINAMKRFKMNITSSSYNWKKEQMNYLYEKDKNNTILNRPIKAFDHLWDASRYGFLDIVNIKELPKFL